MAISQIILILLHVVSHTIANENSSETDGIQKYFYVYNKACKIPVIPIFTPALLKIWHPPKFKTCTNDTDLIIKHFDKRVNQYVLRINDDILKKSGGKNDFTCFYEEIIKTYIGRSGRESAKVKRKIYFKNNTLIPRNVQFIMTKCFDKAKKLLQADAFAFLQYTERRWTSISKRSQKPKPKPKSQRPIRSTNKKPKNNQQRKRKSSRTKPKNKRPSNPAPRDRKPNIILLGLDSMSRANFRRTMPKMFRFMEDNGWYEMQGYNKVADNTLPNLMAVLTGYTTDTSARKVCDTNVHGCFDKLPFVWKDFKKAGYMTAYAEDVTYINTFNYLKPGFQKQPVDFYLRPFLLGIENHMGFNTYLGFKYCVGRRLSFDYVYNYGLEFIKQFDERQPIFGIFWSNTFTHDNYDGGAALDDKLVRFYLNLSEMNVFNKSIVIALSDHGMRYGEIRSLPEGYLEERLPMLFISLPPWFVKKYPEYAEALKLNKHRLTSPYDLHMTLKHISQLGTSRNPNFKPEPPSDCPDCQSLLYPVPDDRDCDDASIGEHWCTCDTFETIEENSLTRNITNMIIERINTYIRYNNWSNFCSNLTLKSMSVADRIINLNTTNNDIDTYRIKFKVEPKNAQFEATVKYNKILQNVKVNVETISRLNSYKSVSECLQHKIGKKYCVCL